MDKKKLSSLSKDEFNKFYQEALQVILDAKKNPGAARTSVSIQDILDKANLDINASPELQEMIAPALTANLYEPSNQAANNCAACSVCALCVFCAELNSGAGLLSLAGISSIASSNQPQPATE